jgi:GMP synthase-like glutamine amidotransferase
VSNPRVLVIENDPEDPAGRLGEWLVDAGATLHEIRPYAGDPIPETLDGFGAMIVLGGEQHAFAGPDGTAGAPWFPALEGLLRKAVRYRTPTLGICLGGQLLATAHGGTVEPSPSGPEIGPRLVARRDIAENDPLFARVPFAPDVFQWHFDEITELPPAAVLLAASTRYPHQAFRLGDRAWGTQFHIECDVAMMAVWAKGNEQTLDTLGISVADLLAAVDAVLADIEEVWQPFAARFVAVARGEDTGIAAGPGRALPLLGL